MKIHRPTFSFFKRLRQFDRFLHRFSYVLIQLPLSGVLLAAIFYLVFEASTHIRIAKEAQKQTEQVQKTMTSSYAVVSLQDGTSRYIPDWRNPIPVTDNGGPFKPPTAWIVKSWDNDITIPFSHALSITPCVGMPPEDMEPFLYVPNARTKNAPSFRAAPPPVPKHEIGTL